MNASNDSILIEIDSNVQESELNTVINNVSSLSSINNPTTESTPVDLVSESNFNASGDSVEIKIDSSVQESESNAAINNGSSQSNVELSNSSNENNNNGITNKEWVLDDSKDFTPENLIEKLSQRGSYNLKLFM